VKGTPCKISLSKPMFFIWLGVCGIIGTLTL
jgi:hypothetical protein